MILNFNKTKEILKKYKIPFCKSEIFISKDRALKFAKKSGFPVVLKIFSPDILHRTDIGGVKIGIKNEKEFKSAFDGILNSVKKKMPRAKIDGILVQKMAEGTEIILGMKRDKVFGPIIMFGGGGIFTELLKDVSLGICPLNRKEARNMIRKTKIFKILKGFRGYPKVNLEKLIQLILNFSKLAQKEEIIKEIDLNPVIVSKKQTIVVDVKFLI